MVNGKWQMANGKWQISLPYEGGVTAVTEGMIAKNTDSLETV